MASPASESGDSATIAALIEKLRDDDSSGMEEAAEALAAMGPSAVPALIDALGQDEWRLRRGAVVALWKIGPAAKDAVPALRKALGSEDWSVHEMVACALGEIGPAAKDAVPALITAIRRGRGSIRHWAGQALRAIGSEAMPALMATFGDWTCDAEVIDEALVAMGSHAVPDLLDVLRRDDPDPEPRGRAVKMLERIGSEAIPGLVAVWSDETDVIRIETGRILMQIDPHLMIAMLKEEASEEAAAEEWDVEAVPLMRLLKRFYLLGCFYKEGVTSFRGAEDAINDQRYKLYQSFDRENIAATATSFSNIKTSPLPALFGKIFGRPNLSLFVESARSPSGKNRRVPTGIADRLSEEGWEAWTWTDGFLRRRLPPDWFGFSRLIPEKNSDSGA